MNINQSFMSEKFERCEIWAMFVLRVPPRVSRACFLAGASRFVFPHFIVFINNGGFPSRSEVLTIIYYDFARKTRTKIQN